MSLPEAELTAGSGQRHEANILTETSEGKAWPWFATVPVGRLGTTDGRGYYSDDWETLWWVRADGRATILAEHRLMAAPLRLLANRYWQYRQAPATGTRTTGTPATGGPTS